MWERRQVLLVLALIFISSTFGSSRYTVNVPAGDWATIRNAAGEYVLGNAGSGWTFDVDNTAQNPWYYGFLYGDVNFCGWMLNNNLNNDEESGEDNCSSGGTEFPLSSFASLTNSQPYNDGAPVDTTCSTYVYANVNPMGNIYGTDIIRTLPAGYEVLWRFFRSLFFFFIATHST